MQWAKQRPKPTWDLAGSNLLHCAIEDLAGARDALVLGGPNDNGWLPLVDAISACYRVERRQVATAVGTSGANFLACAALLDPGDDVLVERPGYDPLLAIPQLLGARTIRFDRRYEDGFALDPDRVASALTPATRLIVIADLHNPSGVLASADALAEVGRNRRAGRRLRAGGRGVPGCDLGGPAAGGPSRRPLRVNQQPDEVLRPVRPALRVGAGLARSRRADSAGARYRGRDRRGAGRGAGGPGVSAD